jgi:diacylglycerol kinase (ATP)
MRLGVLSNLRAGKRDAKNKNMLGFLAGYPEVVHRETSDDQAVAGALAEFAAADVDVLVLNGGDGTIQLALTHLFGNPGRRWRPWIAPIRGGRTNMTALDLGAHRDPLRGLAALIAADRAGRLADRVRLRSVLRVEIGDEVHYGMFLGFGMLHRAVELTLRTFPAGRAQGVFGAGVVTGILVARAAAGAVRGVLTPDKMRVSLDGVSEEPAEILLAMATTLDRLFLRLDPFWGEEEAPVRVTFIAPGARDIKRAALGVMRGRPPAHVRPENGYTSRNVEELLVQLDAGLVLDGELFAPQPDRLVRVRALEGVRFLRA